MAQEVVRRLVDFPTNRANVICCGQTEHTSKHLSWLLITNCIIAGLLINPIIPGGRLCAKIAQTRLLSSPKNLNII